MATITYAASPEFAGLSAENLGPNSSEEKRPEIVIREYGQKPFKN